MKTTLTIDYRAYLGEFLDNKGLKWVHNSIPHVGDIVTIHFDKEMNAAEIWEFAMEFKEFQYRIQINY